MNREITSSSPNLVFLSTAVMVIVMVSELCNSYIVIVWILAVNSQFLRAKWVAIYP